MRINRAEAMQQVTRFASKLNARVAGLDQPLSKRRRRQFRPGNIAESSFDTLCISFIED